MKSKGFTLIEVLAVIVLLGIVSAFAVTAVFNINRKQQEENYKNSISSILSGASNYYTDHIGGTGAPTLRTLIDDGYVELDNDYVTRIGETTEVTKEYCSGSATKVRISIQVPASYKGSDETKIYNNCGCLNQNDESDEQLCVSDSGAAEEVLEESDPEVID